MKILIDVLGADKGVGEIVKGAISALDKINYTPIFVGPEDEIKKYLPESIKGKYEIINANDLITNNDKPTTAIRRKKDSSMVMAFHALKDNKADGMISTGSTGALLAGASLIIGRIENVDRAAITLIFPGLESNTVILDVGANLDINPELLVQFAKMGSSYAKVLFDIDKPKVGLLNIGTEEAKGNEQVKAAYELLKNSDINFAGNVEPFNLLNNNVDVIVTDGFVGNIALKSVEGTSKIILNLFNEAVMTDMSSKIGGLLIKPALKKELSKLDLNSTGAAPLLGSKKPVFKAHGSSNAKQIEAGLVQMKKFIDQDVINDIKNLMGGK